MRVMGIEKLFSWMKHLQCKIIAIPLISATHSCGTPQKFRIQTLLFLPVSRPLDLMIFTPMRHQAVGMNFPKLVKVRRQTPPV
jgi:hypothetical protein